jgi:hypothetical protein
MNGGKTEDFFRIYYSQERLPLYEGCLKITHRPIPLAHQDPQRRHFMARSLRFSLIRDFFGMPDSREFGRFEKSIAE